MHYRYCMNDIYEWTPKRIISLEYQTHEPQYDTDDLGTILHALHQLGTAKEFLIDGSFVGEITWEEGASADDKFVFDQIADTMKNIEGNSRWAWSNCYDVYVGDKSPTSIDYRTIP